MIKEEEGGDNHGRHDSGEYPDTGQLVKRHEESGAGRVRGAEGGGADLKSLFVESGELADMRHPNEYDDADCCGIFGETHADVAVEQRGPFICSCEKDGDEHGSDGANDSVEECGEREAGMRALELLNRFVEVDDGVEEGEDLCVERRNIAHCPVMRIKRGEDVVQPGGMDKCPSHEGKEGDVE